MEEKTTRISMFYLGMPFLLSLFLFGVLLGRGESSRSPPERYDDDDDDVSSVSVSFVFSFVLLVR